MLKRIAPLLLLAFMFSCKQEPQKMTLTLQLDEVDLEQEYKVNLNSGFSLTSDFTFHFVKDQLEYKIDIPLKEAKMISVSGDFRKTIYVEPGKNLAIKPFKIDEEYAYSYEGEGSDFMKILDSLSSIDSKYQEPFKEIKNRQYSLPWEEFLAGIRSNKKSKVEYISSLENLTPEFALILDAEIFASQMLDFQSYKNVFDYTKEAGEEFNAPELEGIFQKAFEFDPKALGSSKFTNLLNGYVNIEGLKSLGDLGDIPWYSLDENFKNMYRFVKADARVPEVFKGPILKNYVSMLTVSLGIDSSWEIKEDFVNSYPNLEGIKGINKQYSELEPLRSGNDAPDFEYESLEGEMVSLSSLKGNVIYVDIWATWCGPCISEFPSYKKLKERLKNADDVKWIYVSVDDQKDKEKWIKFLAKNELDGIQLFGDSGWESGIMDSYKVQGIPRYLLIDKEGKIFSANASRPSSGDAIYNDIQKLRSVSMDKALTLD